MTEFTRPHDGTTSETAADLAQRIHNREITSREVTQAYLDRISETNETLNSFLHVGADEALAAADAVDKALDNGEKPASPLAGVPLALKDLLVTTDAPTTAASKMLEGYRSPYDATVTRRLREAGIPILGKPNLDEFAMGSSNENSAFGPVRNPYDTERTPGGSGGGTAAALASGQAPLGIGTDTVLDTALLHEVIAGHDPHDATSINKPVPDVVAAAREGARGDVTGLKVGVIKQFERDGWQTGVMDQYRKAVQTLVDNGAEVVEVDCPHFDDALAAYYLIMPCEVSSNLARFDGMRYGKRVGDDGENSANREAGFGPEVKRRIMVGTYALSVGYYDAYYLQAQRIRTLVAQDFARAYEKVDVLVSPTTPTTAFPLGEKVEDPTAMYNFDLCTLPLNLAGVCGMSVPSGMAADTQLPTGLQIMAPAFADDRLYRVGAAYEALTSN